MNCYSLVGPCICCAGILSDCGCNDSNVRKIGLGVTPTGMGQAKFYGSKQWWPQQMIDSYSREDQKAVRKIHRYSLATAICIYNFSNMLFVILARLWTLLQVYVENLHPFFDTLSNSFSSLLVISTPPYLLFPLTIYWSSKILPLVLLKCVSAWYIANY
jgi:hypothetical protein